MELAPIYRSAVRQVDLRIRQVGEGQWQAPTPAGGRTVTELVGHLIEGQRRLSATMGGGAADPTAAPAGTDPAAVWQADSRAAIAAMSGAELDHASVAAGWRTAADLTVHAWDLARAIGAPDELSNDLVSAVLERARDGGDWSLDEPVAAPIPVPGCTDDLIELLALTGRNRWWRPDR